MCSISALSPTAEASVASLSLELLDHHGTILSPVMAPMAYGRSFAGVPGSDGAYYPRVTEPPAPTTPWLRHAHFDTSPASGAQSIWRRAAQRKGSLGGTGSGVLGAARPQRRISCRSVRCPRLQVDIQRDGNMSDGTNDAYDGGLRQSLLPSLPACPRTWAGRS